MAIVSRRQPGYTMIELLTVVTIVAILSLAAVQILLHGQLRSGQAEAIAKIRQEGIFVEDQITYQLRNGQSVACTSPQQLDLMTRYGPISYTLSADGKAIASGSALLTTQDVEVQSLNFTCQDSAGSGGTLVEVKYALTTPELAQTMADFSQEFSTSVYVRDLN
jgi:prepilin-type N-terminal cleavage/methylation domain-containing protein